MSEPSPNSSSVVSGVMVRPGPRRRTTSITLRGVACDLPGLRSRPIPRPIVRSPGVSACACLPYGAAPTPAKRRSFGSSDDPRGVGSALRTTLSGSAPESRISTAWTCSFPPMVAPTTAASRIPPTSCRTRSTSSGKTLRPSGVTIISFFRPRTDSRPALSMLPMSPVRNHPSENAAAVSLGAL